MVKELIEKYSPHLVAFKCANGDLHAVERDMPITNEMVVKDLQSIQKAIEDVIDGYDGHELTVFMMDDLKEILVG